MPRRLALTLVAGAVALGACSPTADAPSAPGLPAAPRRAVNVGGVVEVTTAAADGPGSLRAAIALANADRTVNTIRAARGLGPIAVATPIVYTGAQALTVEGNGVRLDAAALAENAPARDAALVANGGADLTLRSLVVENSTGNGILVDVPAARTGVIDVRIENVTVTGSREHGIIVNEQTNFFTRDTESREQGGAPADLRVTVRNTRAANNGFAALDRDGLRINEGGAGSLEADIANSVFEGNGADGIELDERDAGDVVFSVIQTRIDRNGFYSAVDYDDGIDVDEIGPGLLYGSFVGVTASGNAEQGIDLNENNLGDLLVGMQQVTANGNGEEGIEFEEDDDFDDFPTEAWGGNVTATLVQVTANRNGANDGDAGIKVREKFAGNLVARLNGAVGNDNASPTNADATAAGIQVREGEAGSLDAEITNGESLRNEGEGIDIRQGDEGTVTATVRRAVSSNNGGAGVRFRDRGTANVLALTATGNTQAVRTTGVTVTTVP
jgi:hypothetical protein